MTFYCRACLPGSIRKGVGSLDNICGDCVKRTGVKNPPRAPRPRILQNGKDQNANRDAKRAAEKLEKQKKKPHISGSTTVVPLKPKRSLHSPRPSLISMLNFLRSKHSFPTVR